MPRDALLVGQLRAPRTRKPLSGLLRTLSGSQKVLRRRVWGFPYTGCTETLSNFTPRMTKTKTMVLVFFGFGFPSSAGFQGKVVLVSGKVVLVFGFSFA